MISKHRHQIHIHNTGIHKISENITMHEIQHCMALHYIYNISYETLHIYMYIYKYIYIYTQDKTYTQTHTYETNNYVMYIYINLYVYIHICAQICIYIYTEGGERSENERQISSNFNIMTWQETARKHVLLAIDAGGPMPETDQPGDDS